MIAPIEHVDLLGQPINVGDHVSFTWSRTGRYHNQADKTACKIDIQ